MKFQVTTTTGKPLTIHVKGVKMTFLPDEPREVDVLEGTAKMMSKYGVLRFVPSAPPAKPSAAPKATPAKQPVAAQPSDQPKP